MTTSRSTLRPRDAATGALMLAIATIVAPQTATAQGGPGLGGPPSPEMMKRMCEDRGAHFAGRMSFIMTKVGIKPEQAAAWEQFVASARTAEASFDPCKDGPPPFSDPIAMRARLDQMLEKGAEVHKIMKAAADRLSTSLDRDQQRKFAEALLPPPGMRPPFGPPGPL